MISCITMVNERIWGEDSNTQESSTRREQRIGVRTWLKADAPMAESTVPAHATVRT